MMSIIEAGCWPVPIFKRRGNDLPLPISREKMVSAPNYHRYYSRDIGYGSNLCTTVYIGDVSLEVFRRSPSYADGYAGFIRDMALGGPYFSPFLLNVIYAHACRHIDTEDPNYEVVGRGEVFMQRAKMLLMQEMEQVRPRIPTIQGLLILGGRQCAIGNSSEGWLYTGMAIRMIRDLGLHLNVQKVGRNEKMDPDDLEARKRLFLSAYVWDKSISICLGRPPSLTEMPYRPESILDTSDNEQEWIPFGLANAEKIYPPTNSYNTATFINHCRLAEIINESYQVIYNGRNRPNLIQSVVALEAKVRSFYQSLPDPLRIENISSLDVCPPPHIFSLNILYHTVLILIYRPFLYWSSNPRLNSHELVPRAQRICVEETSSVNEFFKAHGRTFKFKLQTYLVSYCVYTAATIDVFLVRNENQNIADAASQRLTVTLKMLESEARQTPGMQRSIEIIKARMQAPSQSLPYQGQMDQIQGHAASMQQTTMPGMQQTMLPQNAVAPNPESMLPTPASAQPGNPMSMYKGYDQQPLRAMAAGGPSDNPVPSNRQRMAQEGLQYTQQGQPEIYPQNFASQSWNVSSGTSPNQLLLEGWNASAGFVPGVVNWNVQDMAPSIDYDLSLQHQSQM